MEAKMIRGTSHETPAGIRSQSGGGPSSTCVSECDLQSNDTVEYFNLGSSSPPIHSYVSRWTKRSCQASSCPKKVQIGSGGKQGEEEDAHHDATLHLLKWWGSPGDRSGREEGMIKSRCRQGTCQHWEFQVATKKRRGKSMKAGLVMPVSKVYNALKKGRYAPKV